MDSTKTVATVTQQNKAASAQHRILQIPEMLEAILLQLPPMKLLLSQAVCKRWKEAIEGSAKLQMALFLQPAARIHVAENGQYQNDSDDIDASEPTPNPFLLELLREICQRGYVSKTSSMLFKQKYGLWSLGHLDEMGTEIWKHMVLTQPAITSFSTRIEWDSWAASDFDVDLSGHTQVTIRNERGITILDLIEALFKTYTQRHLSFEYDIWIEIPWDIGAPWRPAE